jgi:predicted MFS family arabinose efflux permease
MFAKQILCPLHPGNRDHLSQTHTNPGHLEDHWWPVASSSSPSGQSHRRLGERVILCAEAVLLVLVCFAYGFSRSIFPENIAFIITCICYLLDQVLMSVSMARSTYIKKIALKPEDIQPALSASISIDHFFSIGIALLGGVIWNNFGFQYVFLVGVVIATINFFVARKIKLPIESQTSTAPGLSSASK